MSRHQNLKASAHARSQVNAGAAVDLGALKHGRAPDPTPEQEKAFVDEFFCSEGMLCQCGERIRDEGVTLISFRVGSVPSPQGGAPQRGLQYGADTYHSRACPLIDLRIAELRLTPEAPKPVAIRALPPLEWLDDDDEPVVDPRFVVEETVDVEQEAAA